MTQQGFSVDFTGVEAASSKSLPAGNYLAHIFKVTWGEITGEQSPDKGKPKISVVFKINGGSQNGREVYQTYTFGEKGKPFTKQLGLASGKIKEEDLSGKVDGKQLTKLIDSMQGEEVVIKISQRHDPANSPFDDNKTNSVRAVYSKKSPQAELAKSASNSSKDPLAP